MSVVGRAMAFVLASLVTAPLAAGAQTTPGGFRSSGTLVVSTIIGGSPLDVGGTIAVYCRGNQYRLDVLTLAFPGVNPTAGAIAGALLAPGGATLLYDGTTGALSAYSNGNRAYYAVGPPTASKPAPVDPPAPGKADLLGALGFLARQLQDVSQAHIELTGHSTINGHPTDDLDVLVRRGRPGKAPDDYHAQLALADDLGGLPVRLSVSSAPATAGDFGGSARLDLTSVVLEVPDAAAFAIPSGLTRVDSLGAVLQARR